MVWWPFAVALQGEAANHREVRRSRAGVLSVAEKARHRARQVWITKASESEPLMKCRKRIGDIETGVESLPRDEPGGSLLTGQAGVRHEWWRERGPGSCAELGNLSPRWDGRPVERFVACGRSSGARTPSSRSARGRVVMRGTGADLSVVAVKAL